MPISQRLERAFDCASRDSRAWKLLCDTIAQEFDAIGTLLLPMDKSRRLPWLIASDRLKLTVTEYLAGGWSAQDVRERGLPAGRRRGYVLDSDIGTEAELNKLPYYKELLRPHGIGGLCAILFDVDGVEWAMSVQLPLGMFVPPDEKLALVPEIRTLLEKAAQKCGQSVKDLWESHFNSASFGGGGLAVLNVHGRVVRSNKEFRSILENLSVGGSRPVFPDPFTRLCIERFSTPCENFYRPTPYLIEGNSSIVACTIRRIPEDVRLFSTEDIAVVALTEHSSFEEDLMNVLASSFDLVSSEVKLVLEICKGQKLKTAAQKLGITEGTARQRLKATFRKTGSETQHQLVVNVMKARALLPLR